MENTTKEEEGGRDDDDDDVSLDDIIPRGGGGGGAVTKLRITLSGSPVPLSFDIRAYQRNPFEHVLDLSLSPTLLFLEGGLSLSPLQILCSTTVDSVHDVDTFGSCRKIGGNYSNKRSPLYNYYPTLVCQYKCGKQRGGCLELCPGIPFTIYIQIIHEEHKNRGSPQVMGR